MDELIPIEIEYDVLKDLYKEFKIVVFMGDEQLDVCDEFFHTVSQENYYNFIESDLLCVFIYENQFHEFSIYVKEKVQELEEKEYRCYLYTFDRQILKCVIPHNDYLHTEDSELKLYYTPSHISYINYSISK